MRVLCLVSHEQPGDEPGKFTVYEAGKEYDVDDPEPGLFRLPEDKPKTPRRHEGTKKNEE